MDKIIIQFHIFINMSRYFPNEYFKKFLKNPSYQGPKDYLVLAKYGFV